MSTPLTGAPILGVIVTALLNQNDCASVLYERFVSDLSPGDTSCAHRTPEVRVAPRFPLSLSGMAPARPW